MSNEIRKKIQKILKEEFGSSQKEKLVSILNALEFKNDILAAGGEIYAVGGIVRDAIMGTASDDLDIVVRGIPYDRLFNILSRYGKAKDTSHEKEDGDKDFGSTIFVSHNEKFNNFLAANGVVRDIDVMLPRKDAKDPNIKGHKGIKSDVNPMYTIEDDLQRRDITINAIAMDMDGNIFTSGTGLEDIKNGIIKAVNEDAFIEDPLRMLRAVRFAARYNYDWDPETVNLIKNNASLLADKAELPKERFLKEFEKMIGKADLSRAVKLLVDLGMYKYIFGIEPKINDYGKFANAHNVGEFAYMMFENEPVQSIVPLIEKNITNSKYDLSYAQVLVDYSQLILLSQLSPGERINELSKLYSKNRNTMIESSYIYPEDAKIVAMLESGELPKTKKDIALKGGDIIDIITQEKGDIKKSDRASIGIAQEEALQAIYKGEISNDEESIKNFLISNKDLWLL